jgi:uncharacterized RDD family membrane protein YckC
MPGADPVLGVQLASWGKRVGAYLLDVLVLVVPIVVIFVALAHNHRVTGYNSTGQYYVRTELTLGRQEGAVAISSAIWFVYYFAMLAWRKGQTLGMGAVHIRVRTAADGSLPSKGRSAARTVCWFVSVIPIAGGLLWLLNVLWPLWDSRRQALHDKVAGTVVVYEP